VCTAVILLEGGTEFDLKTLDQAAAEAQRTKRLVGCVEYYSFFIIFCCCIFGITAVLF